MKPTILIDSREQRPFQFNPAVFNVERRGLATGDYTLAGHEDRIAVERKGLGDLVGTVIGDWLRFRKELLRLAAFDVAAIVVEADVSDVLERRYESSANPLSVLGRCHSCFLDHGVPVLFWGHRRQCESMLAQFFRLFLKRHESMEPADAAERLR